MLSINLLIALLLSITYDSAIAQNTTASGATSTASSITTLAAGLSTTCQTAAGSLLTSDLGSCANIIGLASVVGASGSIIAPLNSWITAICSSDPCSNTTLNTAQQTISSGCSADSQKGSPIALGLTSIITNYPSVRNMLCTQYVSNSTFCIPSVLESIQTATGQNISLTTLTTVFSSGFSDSSFSKVPSGAYCNDCGHAIATLSAPIAASTSASMSASMSTGNMTMSMAHSTNSTSTATAGVCGASFSDGKIPSSIKIAAKGSSAAATNAQNSSGARDSVSLFVALSVLSTSLFYLAC